ARSSASILQAYDERSRVGICCVGEEGRCAARLQDHNHAASSHQTAVMGESTMANKTRNLVGTVGQGVMMSGDDGESWTRIGVRSGMHSDGIVRSLLAAPDGTGTVYAGTDMGLYRSDDAGMKWRLLNTPMSGAT